MTDRRRALRAAGFPFQRPACKKIAEFRDIESLPVDRFAPIRLYLEATNCGHGIAIGGQGGRMPPSINTGQRGRSDRGAGSTAPFHVRLRITATRQGKPGAPREKAQATGPGPSSTTTGLPVTRGPVSAAWPRPGKSRCRSACCHRWRSSAWPPLPWRHRPPRSPPDRGPP